MNVLTRMAAEYIAGQTLTVRLRSNKSGEPIEVNGGGYKPVTVQGEAGEHGVKWPDAVFVFTGGVGQVYGWYAEIDGERVEGEGEIFKEPFFVNVMGSRIRVQLSAD